MIDLTNAKLGETYRFYISYYGIVSHWTSSTADCVIIATAKDGKRVMLGHGHYYPTLPGFSTRGLQATNFDYWSEHGNYALVCVVDRSTPAISNEPIAISKADSLSSNGMFCKTCKEFYSYAVSNQQDGSLICYGCRH